MKQLCGLMLMVVAALLFLMPVAGFCRQPEDAAGNSTLKQRIRAWQKTQDWVGEGNFSMITFEMEEYEDIFDKKSYPMVRFASGWYPVENLILVTSMGGIYEKGEAVGAITGEESGEAIELYVLPVQISLRYRFSFMEEQPIIPSIWGGGDYWYFQEVNHYKDNVVGEKWGYHYGADLAFLLDSLDPDAARRLKKHLDIESTYLYAGYEWLAVGEEEDGFEFSGGLYTVGLRFEVAGE